MINDWITTHFARITLLSIPLYTFVSAIVFKKEGYNYVEHLVLNAYLSAQRLSFHILVFPLIYYANGTPYEQKLTILILCGDMCLTIWSYTQFFNKLTKIKAFFLSVLSYLIFFIQVLLLSLLIFGILERAKL